MVLGTEPLNFFMNRLLFIENSRENKIQDVDIQPDNSKGLPVKASRSFNKRRDYDSKTHITVGGEHLPRLIPTKFHETLPNLTRDPIIKDYDRIIDVASEELPNLKEEVVAPPPQDVKEPPKPAPVPVPAPAPVPALAPVVVKKVEAPVVPKRSPSPERPKAPPKEESPPPAPPAPTPPKPGLRKARSEKKKAPNAKPFRKKLPKNRSRMG